MTKMKLWLLKPRDNLPEKNPWEPWYDKAFGFVIRAESEEKARKIANKNGGSETGEISNKVYRTGGNPWLDPELSICIELTPEGKEQLIISDIREA